MLYNILFQLSSFIFLSKLAANGGGMRSWLSDESLSVRPKLRLGRDSTCRIRTNPAMTYTTCYSHVLFSFLSILQ